MKQEDLLMQHVDFLNKEIEEQKQKTRDAIKIIDAAITLAKHAKKCYGMWPSHGCEWIMDFERALGEEV